MSDEAAYWAWLQAGGGAQEKSVLVALGFFADSNGRCCVPRGFIAEKTELPRLAVERALVTLEGRGLIARKARSETAEILLLMGGVR